MPPKRKTELLSLALSAQKALQSDDEKERRVDLLYDILTSPLPVCRRTSDSLPPALRGQARSLQSVAGKTVGDLIQDPQIDLTTIRKIKDHAKKSGTSAKSKAESDAFLAVYYAAIAGALVIHGKKITKHGLEDLTQFFQSFMKKDWVLPELKSLFGKAYDYCQTFGQTRNSK